MSNKYIVSVSIYLYILQLRDKENIEKIKNPFFSCTKPSDDIIERRFHTSKWFWFGFSVLCCEKKRSFLPKQNRICCVRFVCTKVNGIFVILSYSFFFPSSLSIEENNFVKMDTFSLLGEIFFRFCGCVGKHILFNRKDVIKEIENLMLQFNVFEEVSTLYAGE